MMYVLKKVKCYTPLQPLNRAKGFIILLVEVTLMYMLFCLSKQVVCHVYVYEIFIRHVF